jgi:hypothetical protein
MKTKNISKLAAVSAAIMIAGMAQMKAVTLISTNTVQDINVAFTIYSQGATTTNKHDAVITAVNKTTMDTKNFIGFLSTNAFAHPKLVLVVKNNGTTNSVDAFEIRDGTNAPVVVTGLSATDSSGVKSQDAPTNGIVTGVKYSLFSLSATNSSGTETLSLNGFATTKHASIKDGKVTILSVDTLTAGVSGTDIGSGITNVVNGSVNVGGSIISKIQ